MLILKTYLFLMLMTAIDLYIWLVIIYCIAGFFINNRYAGWYVFLRELSEPPLTAIRRLTKGRLVIERFDLSPIVLLLGLQILQRVLAQIFL